MKHLFADGAYDRLKLMDKAAYLDFIVAIVRRSDDHKGFEVLPRRWVVERTFGWMTRWRRLVRDYEARIDVSQACRPAHDTTWRGKRLSPSARRKRLTRTLGCPSAGAGSECRADLAAGSSTSA